MKFQFSIIDIKADVDYILLQRHLTQKGHKMYKLTAQIMRIFSLFLLATLGLVQISHAQTQALSLEEVVSLKQVTSVHMSPNGDQIAYLLSAPRALYKDDDGEAYQELHLVDLDGNSRPFVTGKINITKAAWSADGKLVYFLAKRDPDEDFNALYEISLTGGEAVEIFKHGNSINNISPSPDGKRIAFLASEAPPEKKKDLEEKGFKAIVFEESVPAVKAWMLDLASKEVVAQNLTGSASDFSWAADSGRYAVALAPTPLIDDSYMSRDIYVVDASSTAVLTRMNSVGKLGHFAFSPDGERIAYIGSVNINDPKQGRLYVVSASGGERRELVRDYLGHVDDFAWQSDLNIRYLGNRGVWTEFSRVSLIDTQPASEAPESGPIIRRFDIGAGQITAAAIADTPQHPREVYLLGDGVEPRRLTNSNPILGERRLARQEPITYQARDGLQLEAILIHPFDKKRGGNPLIVFVHGGPEGHQSNGWMSTYSQPGQVLAAEGYTIVYPNYRGSTGRGVEFSRLGQNDYAEEEFNDLVDVKTHLVGKGLADADHVGISGGSYGGYASMWAATALSEEFTAAVAFVGISNQTSKFGTGDIPYEMFYVHSRAWPWEDWMWMLKRSPIYHADKAKTPLLIMGGDKDPRVHPGQSLEMYRHVKLRTNTPVRLVIYPGEVHGNRHTAARYDYSLRLERWMNHYLKGPGGEPPPYEIDHGIRLEMESE
jgi:dipeptidyl aminopeptidase/acylaminoacyl peptidase